MPLAAAAPPALALSGGGIIALVSSVCQLHALEEMFPDRHLPTTSQIGATSGGIVGGVLHATAHGRLGFPPSWLPKDYGNGTAHKELSQRYKIPGMKDSVWFGAITDVLDPLQAAARPAEASSSSSSSGDGDAASIGGSATARGGAWWTDVLAVAARLYGLRGSGFQRPPNIFTTISLLRDAAAPLDRTPAGVLRNASSNLFPAEIVSATAPAAESVGGGGGGGGGVLRVVGSTSKDGPPPVDVADVLTATAYATSFWAAPLLESKLAYELVGKALLPRYPPPHDGFFLLDGGTHDSTALASLARRKARRVLSFYNDAVDLHSYSAQLGFVFGVANRTTSLAMWEGARLGQLFPSRYWPAVLANLTDPGNGVALLRDLPVLPNAWLGVEGGYTIDSLLILATQYSEPFLRAFDAVDPLVRRGLRKGWPEAVDLLGMSPLETNTLCMLAGWRVVQAEGLIREAMEG